MPDETPVLKLPYPLPEDALVDYPALGRDLAETIEASVGRIIGRFVASAGALAEQRPAGEPAAGVPEFRGVYEPPAGCRALLVELVAGGGGGGGAGPGGNSTGAIAAGGGGGAGSYASKLILDPVGPFDFVVGAGGAGGPPDPGAGGNGGDSWLGDVELALALAGIGGQPGGANYANQHYTNGGVGGGGGVGDLLIPGGGGGLGFGVSGGNGSPIQMAAGGPGAASIFGAGGAAGQGQGFATSGDTARPFGAGGGGGAMVAGGWASGGAGAGGLLVVTAFG
jgi:hypothetical protein